MTLCITTLKILSEQLNLLSEQLKKLSLGILFNCKINSQLIRYMESNDYNPAVCRSGVGRYSNGPTETVINSACYGRDKFHNGIAWVVLHEVSNIPFRYRFEKLIICILQNFTRPGRNSLFRLCMHLDFTTNINDRIAIGM